MFSSVLLLLLLLVLKTVNIILETTGTPQYQIQMVNQENREFL